MFFIILIYLIFTHLYLFRYISLDLHLFNWLKVNLKCCQTWQTWLIMPTCKYHSQPEANQTWLDSTCFLSFEWSITTLKAARNGCFSFTCSFFWSLFCVWNRVGKGCLPLLNWAQRMWRIVMGHRSFWTHHRRRNAASRAFSRHTLLYFSLLVGLPSVSVSKKPSRKLSVLLSKWKNTFLN